MIAITLHVKGITWQMTKPQDHLIIKHGKYCIYYDRQAENYKAKDMTDDRILAVDKLPTEVIKEVSSLILDDYAQKFQPSWEQASV